MNSVPLIDFLFIHSDRIIFRTIYCNYFKSYILFVQCLNFSEIQTNLPLTTMNLERIRDYDTTTCLSIPSTQLLYWWLEFHPYHPPTVQDIDVWVRSWFISIKPRSNSVINYI